jgi:hypothetical protein
MIQNSAARNNQVRFFVAFRNHLTLRDLGRLVLLPVFIRIEFAEPARTLFRRGHDMSEYAVRVLPDDAATHC